MNQLPRAAKAIFALIGAVATWGITAAEDGVYTQVELWGALLALATAVGVFVVPNRPPDGQPSDPSVSEQDPQRGAVAIIEICFVVIAAIFVLWAVGVVPR
jgi:hypothetical protein